MRSIGAGMPLMRHACAQGGRWPKARPPAPRDGARGGIIVMDASTDETAAGPRPHAWPGCQAARGREEEDSGRQRRRDSVGRADPRRAEEAAE